MNAKFLLVFPVVIFLLAACGGVDGPVDTGKQPIVGQPYQSDCLEREWGYGAGDSVEILVGGNAMTIVDHHAEFNCCLLSWMEVEIDGTDITVVEVEDPDKRGACRCICPFELSVGVSDLPDGLYTVKVYRADLDGHTLLLDQAVRIPLVEEPECVRDSDCLEMPWEIYCLGHWDCVAGQCQEVCDMDGCGDGTCDSAGGESEQSCPQDCLVQPECRTHEECGGMMEQSWCILGECLPGELPCTAAGGVCTLESECPEGYYPPKDPGFMHCARCGRCGYCCLSWGCPDLIECPEGTTCSAEGTCVPGS